MRMASAMAAAAAAETPEDDEDEEEEEEGDLSAGMSARVSVLAKNATAAESPAETSLAAGEGLLLLLLLRRSAKRPSRG